MPGMLVLVLNCGSSSLKFALVNPQSGEVRLSGLAERLGSAEAALRLSDPAGRTTRPLPGGDYAAAFSELLSELEGRGLRSEVGAVGHRVVHGASAFSAPALITPQVLDAVRGCIPLAPLHNPANLAGIEAAQAAFPELKQVAVFDTAFHQTMPEVAYRYAVPAEWAREYGVRRYGFHGISHAYVSGEAARELGGGGDLRLVSAHLGNGSSVCAVRGGRSQDTSMGLTPLEGLVMGTRSGDVDPGLHDYLARTAGLSLEEVTQALNRRSGLLGLSERASDMRELEGAAYGAEADAGAALAIEAYVYRLAQYVAAMAASLGGLDGLIFTGGIGENSVWVREKTVERLGFLGLELDQAANREAVGGIRRRVSTPQSRPVLVIPTDEEGLIARQTVEVVGRGA